MRLSQAEKMEIIRIVEGSQLSLRQTLRELGGGPQHLLWLLSALPGGRL